LNGRVLFLGRFIIYFARRLGCLSEEVSGLEIGARYTALSNNGEQGAGLDFGVVRDGYSNRPGLRATLHDDMAAPPAHRGKAVLLKNPAYLSP
jgi:hypothetical protein